MGKTKLAIVLLALSTSAFGAQTFMVDDDGNDCAGALTMIQVAVDQASAGDTIVVCRGTYRGAVVISGHEKDNLQLVAREGDEVVIEGDHTQAIGIALIDVDGVLVRGLTIRDFGTATGGAPDEDGVGAGIQLLRANLCTIDSNEIFGNDMAGVLLLDSKANILQNNTIHDNDPDGTGRGIHIQALRAAGNIVRRNRISRHPLAGVLIRDAGDGNEVLENNLNDNGRFGVANLATNGTRIEANRASDERGLWSFPAVSQMSYGVYIGDSTDIEVREIMAFANSYDVFWDGKGRVEFVRIGTDRDIERGPKRY